MERIYKLILSNRNMYKEIDLFPDVRELSIGTYNDNDVRLEKDLFLSDFYITALQPESGSWELESSANVYFFLGDIRKMMRIKVKHGDDVGLRYQQASDDFLRISFSINFDHYDRKFSDVIDLSTLDSIRIGGSKSSDILLKSEFAADESVLFKKEQNKLAIKKIQGKYGVLIDGVSADENSYVHDGDFISIADYQFYFKDGCLYTDSNGLMSFNNVNCTTLENDSSFEYPVFNRNTRIRSLVPLDQIDVLDPPDKPEKPKNNLLLSIMPSVVMLILTVVIRGFMSESSSYTFVIFSACSIGLGIITSIITFIQTNKEYKKNVADRETNYRAYISDKEKQITDYRNNERRIINYNYPSLKELLGKAERFSGDIFDRTINDNDFLDVRIGKGSEEAQRKISYKVKEKFVSSDELSYLPEQITEKYRNVDDVSIVIKMKDAGAVGIIGRDNDTHCFARNIILDLVLRQFKDDLKLAFVLNEETKKEFDWIRYLPHVQNEENNTRLIGADVDTRTNLFEYLYKVLNEREAAAGGKNAIQNTHLMIFVLDSKNLMTHPLSRFIAIAASINVTFIFFEKAKDLLPLGVTSIVQVNSNRAELVETSDENKKKTIEYEMITDQQAEDLSIRIAPVSVPEINLEGSLVKSISLFELLDIYAIEDLDLEKRWAESEVHRSMAAPIGVKSKDEIVALDIHEKMHGPHGLVAGTTGSGKSELLQSYILSMATLFHPYEVGFVIIDFKGGGMANQFADLPHLMGTITNIDGKQIDRSLMSIKAELLKRQRMFADADVNHIDKYITKFKNGEVKEPLPHLIIVVDEFAELKAEYPDFMKELISASRIGRSLGVHLILATQKPSGQVNEQIWGNSRFKLCLKVQSPEDSNEMLKSPLAAEIKEPGRAYFQVGNNEIFDLFQSGYSGAPEKLSTDILAARKYQLSEVSFEGKRTTIFIQNPKREVKNVRTQLEALVDYIGDYCNAHSIAKLSNICLPPLPETLPFPVETEKVDSTDIVVQIGLLDDPANQRQIPTYINFTQENTMVVGSSQYGKTNLLQLIIRSLATCYSPDEVSIYILDFGSMILKNFESLKHVGGVVIPSEDEKFKNLMKMLLAEIEIRRQRLIDAGVSSFASYFDAGFRDLPQIVLLIDNFTAVKEYYLQEEDPIMQLSREGLSVGISIVMANSQTSGMGYRYLSNFSKRIVFYCNETSEYSNVIEKCKLEPDNIPGRAITEIDKSVYEFQSYLSFEGEREIERVNEMRNFIGSCNMLYHSSARQIPVVPDILEFEDFSKNYRVSDGNKYNIPVALGYDPIVPVTVDLLNQGWFAVSGQDGMGKYNLLNLILDHLYNKMFDAPADVYILDGVDRKLSKFNEYSVVQEYSIDASDILVWIEDIHKELSDRLSDTAAGDIDLTEESLKLVIVRNQDAIEQLCKNSAGMNAYKELVGKLRSMKVCFIYMDVPNSGIAYSSPEILKNIKESKNLFFFDDLQNLKICDVSSATVRKFKKKLAKGDCYLLVNNEISKVKTIKRKGGLDYGG